MVLTDPAYVKHWQYGSDLNTDWSIGFPIRFTSEWEGKTYEQWGTVLAFDAPTELRYSLFAPRPDLEDTSANYFTMSYILETVEGATTLTITKDDPREGVESEGDETGDNNPVLVALKDLAESIRTMPTES
jgi:hypothetical protein